MKTFLLAFTLLLLGLVGYSQSCSEMLAAAEKAERAGQFRSAIQKYNAAARRCGPSQAAEIDAKVLGVFDRIEALRERAERAENVAKERANALARQIERTDSVLTIVKTERDKNERIISSLYFYQDRFGLAIETDGNQEEYSLLGYMDKQGNMTIPFQYEYAERFDAEFGLAEVIAFGEQRCLIDTFGTEYPLARRLNELADDIQALDLRNQNLSALPDSVFQYTQLKYLFLSGNQLTRLPKDIKNLTKLKILDLDENQLPALPNEIGALQELEYLSLSANQLTDLPLTFTQLKNLKRLFLWDNKVEVIPEGIWSWLNDNGIDCRLEGNPINTLPNDSKNLSMDLLGELYGSILEDVDNHFSKLSRNQAATLEDSLNTLTRIKIQANNLDKLIIDVLDHRSKHVPPEEVYDIYLDEEAYKDLLSIFEDLGKVQFQLGLFADSEISFRKIQNMPGDPIILHQLPLVLLMQGKFEQAKELYLKWKNEKPPYRYLRKNIKSCGALFLKDIAEQESKGLVPAQFKEDVEAIKKLLQE